MKPRDSALASALGRRLAQFEIDHGLLPGIEDQASRDAFIEQLLESIRRIDFVRLIKSRNIPASRCNPNSDIYDPLRAAIHFHQCGHIDEAFWQVFLFVHFGKHRRDGWRLARDVYGRLGSGKKWGWKEVSQSPEAFKQWLELNLKALKGADGIPRRFGNHRKYISLNSSSSAGTGAAVETYVKWVMEAGGHQKLIENAILDSEGDPKIAFDLLYARMSAVASFGRTARFDYLTMLGKLDFANIEPGSTYMSGATGPLAGAKLLLGAGDRSSYDLSLIRMGSALGVGMQVMEDAICNWQKSPSAFVPFRG